MLQKAWPRQKGFHSYNPINKNPNRTLKIRPDFDKLQLNCNKECYKKGQYIVIQ